MNEGMISESKSTSVFWSWDTWGGGGGSAAQSYCAVPLKVEAQRVLLQMILTFVLIFIQTRFPYSL